MSLTPALHTRQITSKFPIDAWSLIDARQSEHISKAHTYTQNHALKHSVHYTKCVNLTPISVLVDDDKRININIRYIRYYNMQ